MSRGYEPLLASSDPVRREMGEALRDGASPRHLLAIPEYRAQLLSAVERLAATVTEERATPTQPETLPED